MGASQGAQALLGRSWNSPLPDKTCDGRDAYELEALVRKFGAQERT